MKSVIAAGAIVLGSITGAYAEEPMSQDRLPVVPQKWISILNATKTPLILQETVGEKVQKTLEWESMRHNEEWKQNAEHFAKYLLPGNPVGYHVNWIQALAYPIIDSKNWVKLYVWALRSYGETRYNAGIILDIPLWK